MTGPYILSLRIPGAPADNSITEIFGELSRAGAGSGVPVSGSAISTGDPLGHWQIVSGVICPSAAGDAANLNAGPYSLTLDNGQIAYLSIEANAWSVSTQAEWDFVIAQSSTTLGGKTIRVRQLAGGTTYVSGVNGSAARLRRADYAGLVIRSDKLSAPAIFDKFVVRGARNLSFFDLLTPETVDSKFSFIGEAANFVTGITVSGNHIRGVPQDPYGDFSFGPGAGAQQYPNLDMVVFSGTPAWLGDISVINNHITWCLRGVNGTAGTGTVNTSGNRIQYYYDDGINWSYGGADVPWTCNDNVISHCMGRVDDNFPNGPHPDAIRGAANTLATTDWTVDISRNRLFQGAARGQGQAILLSDFKSQGVDSGHFYTGQAVGNVVAWATPHALSVENAKDFVIANNTIVEGDTMGLTQSVIRCGAGSTDSTSSGTHQLTRNISDAYTLGGSPILIDNLTLGSGGATIPYDTVFDGPIFASETLEDMMAFFNMKAGGPADIGGSIKCGAIGSGSVTWATSVPGNNGVSNGETSPMVTLINDFGIWGASNISGDQDGTGVTIRTAALPFITTSTQAKYLTNGANTSFGYSGAPMATVLGYITSATTAQKAADTVLQVAGSNDFGGGSTTVSSAYTTWESMKAAIGHSRLITWTAFHASTSAGGAAWSEKTDFLRRISDADPHVESLASYTRDPAYYPPADSADELDQARDMIPTSYKFNAGHCNAAGYTIQGEDILIPVIRGMQAGQPPYILRRELYSKEPTNQTNGGLVGNISYYGDLTGTTVSCDNADFAVAVVGSDLKLSRATGTSLLADYYDVAVTTSKAGRTATGVVRVLLGASNTAVRRVYHNGAARYAQWEGFAGVANGGRFSFFLDWEPTDASQDTTALQLIKAVGANGIDLIRQGSGWLQMILRSSAGSTAINLTNAGGVNGVLRVAGGRRSIFGSVDIAAGVGHLIVDTIAHGLTTTAPGAGATTIGLSGAHRRLSSVDAYPSTSVPKCNIGTWWEAADYIDFSQEANRALFRNVSTKACLDLGVTGTVVVAAGTGAGNSIAPYFNQCGAAADRYMGENRGYGTAGSGASKAGTILGVTNPPARWTTLA